MVTKLGMALRTYREWERPGHRKWESVAGSLVLKLSEATGVSFTWLLCGDYYLDLPPSAVPLVEGGEPMPPITRHCPYPR